MYCFYFLLCLNLICKKQFNTTPISAIKQRTGRQQFHMKASESFRDYITPSCSASVSLKFYTTFTCASISHHPSSCVLLWKQQCCSATFALSSRYVLNSSVPNKKNRQQSAKFSPFTWAVEGAWREKERLKMREALQQNTKRKNKQNVAQVCRGIHMRAFPDWKKWKKTRGYEGEWDCSASHPHSVLHGWFLLHIRSYFFLFKKKKILVVTCDASLTQIIHALKNSD